MTVPSDRPSRAFRAVDHYRALRKNVQRELVAAALLAVLFMSLAVHENAMERVILWSSVHTVWLLDEIFSCLVISGLALCVFAIRRWRELQIEVRERTAAEVALRASEERSERVFSSSPLPILVMAVEDGRLLACNAEFESVTGHSSAQVLGQSTATIELWKHADFSASLQQRLDANERIRNEEVEFRTSAGVVHQALLSATLISFGGMPAALLALNDVSDRRALEQRLEFQAFHDSLTGLANRALFRLRLQHALVRAPRTGTHPMVLFLDLDDFKRVNDSLGHAVGDELLVAVAKRLGGCLRAEDTCARLGGDEFAILVEDGNSVGDGTQLAERIIATLHAVFELANNTAYVGVSIGIAFANAEETDDVLLRNADLAMYMSKTDGKGRVTQYTPAMHEEVADRLRLEADLHLALDRNEFVVNYQPIVSIDSGIILSTEALVRWQHPTRGALSPSVFIPIAESSGLMVELGRWILREACTATQQLQQRFPRTPALSVSVNLSGRQIADPYCVQMVEEALRDSGLSPYSLILEITESVLVHNVPEIVERLWTLKRMGIRLAIDDFGTGYSSLSYLQRFPVDILKIDKSFIDRLGNGAEESAIARAVVALGSSVSLLTIAEGIETDEQWDRLRELGCERGQGFLFARPGDMCALDALLAAEDAAPDALAMAS